MDADVAETVDVHGLIQHVKSPTRASNLPAIFPTESSRPMSMRVENDCIVDTTFSEYELVIATIGVNLEMSRPPTAFSGCDQRHVDPNDLERRLRQSIFSAAPNDTSC